MSVYNNDNNTPVTVEKLAEANVAEIKVLRGSEAYNEARLKESPSFRNLITWRLMGCLLLGCFCQTMNGFDGSLFNGISANNTFTDFFPGAGAAGDWQAVTSAMYQVGGLSALPFVGPCIDTWGRRIGMVIGAVLIVIGVVINGCTVYDVSNANAMLKGGRFILGFGVSIVSGAGPIYVVETAHPAWRSIITAYCNTFWFVGSVLAGGACRGAITISGNASWLIPVWLQLFFPALILCFVWFIPESPRWLFVNNKREKATAVLTKWHGKGNPDSPWVSLQLSEYEEHLNMEGADKRWWDYSVFFNNRSNRYRIACNGVFSAFGQLAGNGALSYYMTAVLLTIGITDEIKRTNIILGYGIFQWGFALIGAAFVERIGRRKLMLFSMAGCTVCWTIVTGTASAYSASGGKILADGTVIPGSNHAAGTTVLAFIFIFGAVYSVGITPLQALYPVEVISFEQRAKGMAFSAFCVNAAGLLNGYAWPVALKEISWYTYIIFTIWCAIQTVVFYFLMPETRRRTLEEMDKIFEAPNPVKESLKPHKVAVNSEGTILATEDI
ncbi:uncharacterized protein LTR77_004987 [Saxophila tyrrhenica]|uniref:Major facilitator superfamily (MFS) profile domain-containing protein n=1 Tax=Saxophila tyrrhenica TaxID=1690608 RepID=A0AAV9PF14_9PEZI|nr:hypothetical protein LTR77_004987 [Saxophila tyrrhenica]